MMRVFKNIALVVVSSLFAVVLAEIAFRSWLYNLQKDNVLAFERMQEDGNNRESLHNATLGEIIRPVQHPRLIFELKPGMVATFMDADVVTNKYGFRGPEYETKKRVNTLRIVGIGDSHMFGWGVQYEESYLTLVGQALRELIPECSWEVINTAVPGYNTAMEVETLQKKGLGFSPDLVIIHYVSNDLSLPNFLHRNYWNFKRLYLLYFLYDRFRGHAYGREFLDYTARVGEGGGFEGDPALVPPEYRDIVGIGSYINAMQELKDLAKEYHFGVLVFTQFRFPAEIKKVLDDLNIAFLEGMNAYSNYMTRHGIDRYAGSVLSISATDPHPSKVAHRLQAEAVVNFLQQRIAPVDTPNQESSCSAISRRLQRLRD